MTEPTERGLVLFRNKLLDGTMIIIAAAALVTTAGILLLK